MTVNGPTCTFQFAGTRLRVRETEQVGAIYKTVTPTGSDSATNSVPRKRKNAAAVIRTCGHGQRYENIVKLR